MARGGRSFVSSPPSFSNDGKRLLICTGNTVSVFSTSTGLQVSELEGHAALVTSVVVVPATSTSSKVLCYCWTASLDGTIRYWDFSAPELMKTINIGLPIFSMVIPSLFASSVGDHEKAQDVFAYLSTGEANPSDKKSSGLSGKIQKCNLTKSRLCGGAILAETKKPESIILCPSGKYFGIRDKCTLRIWKVPAKGAEHTEVKKIKLHHTKNLTGFVFHPTERIVAAGDSTGRILIWRGFGSEEFSTDKKKFNRRNSNNEDEKPGVKGNDDAESCTTWHWHSAEVKLLLFSSDGAYLYSGGKEGVLVVWQLDTGKKKFLPRIGSPLIYFTISPDPSISAISCADNRIHVLKMPSMEILKSIAGIKLPCSVPEICKDSFGGLVLDNTTGLVAVCAENYCVQFYSLFDDREISEVQICERNHQPGDEITVIVSLLALSPDGKVMSTVETRLPEEEIGGIVSLKFWTCGSQTKDFSLSTIIYEPHRDSGVSAIAFHPTRRMAATSSFGGDFKIWVADDEIQRKNQMLQKTGWTCHAVGSYKNKSMTAAAFSFDGSVLAVAAESLITLWDPDTNSLVAVIGGTLEPIKGLSFVGESEYLVSTSRGSNSQVSVWSLSKLSLAWCYKLHTEAVACSTSDSSFAVLSLLPESLTESNERKASGDGAILLFNAGDPVPVATWFVQKAQGGGLAFLHADAAKLEEKNSDENQASLLLAYINGDHEFILFDPFSEEADEQGISRRRSLVGSDQETGRLGYASIYGELPEFDLKKNQVASAPFVQSGKLWETIFSGSSQALPPLTKLCSSFLESLLEKRTTEVE